MREILIAYCFLMTSFFAFSQDNDQKATDTLYKEDQFYIGVTYNLLGKKPQGVSQKGFSTGVHLGFIKDIPLNKNRNFGLGIGLGGSINSFNQNLLIVKNDGNTYNYSILDNNSVSYTSNRFYMNLLEMPFEFRWRTSNATEYKFWRIYSGVKFGYLLSNVASFQAEFNDNDIRITQVKDFNNFQYGISFSAGYNTWNFYFYYGLTPIFKKQANIEGEIIEANAIKIGLQFYIL